jgi:hypothetical protein
MLCNFILAYGKNEQTLKYCYASKLSCRHHPAEDTRAFRNEVFWMARPSEKEREEESGGRAVPV